MTRSAKDNSEPAPPVVESEEDFKKVMSALLAVPPMRNGDLKKSGAKARKRPKKKNSR